MTISRRRFLGGLAAGASTLAACDARSAPPPGRYGLLHDTTLCLGCRSCEAACNETNGLPPPAEVQDPAKQRVITERQLTVVNRYRTVYRKHQCMHCSEPCCVSMCPVRALTKTAEGPVLYDPRVCIGCRYCMMACPYYALSYEYKNPATPRVMRCTMCYPRIKRGALPACAEACPSEATIFGKRAALLQLARDRIRKQPRRYRDHVFGESEYGGTSWLVLAAVPFGELGLPAAPSPRPLPELTRRFLRLVPPVLCVYPALLLGIHAFTRRKERLTRAEPR